MYSLVENNSNLQEVDISELPLKVYLDKESGTIIFDTEFDLVFSTKGNIINSAKGKNVILGGEVHLNPKIDVINNNKLQR